jgi:hypothetical protein
MHLAPMHACLLLLMPCGTSVRGKSSSQKWLADGRHELQNSKQQDCNVKACWGCLTLSCTSKLGEVAAVQHYCATYLLLLAEQPW